MHYEDPEPMSRPELMAAFTDENAEVVQRAMVSPAFCESDAVWLGATFLGFLSDPREGVRGVAATCLGHTARLHRQLDLTAVLPALRRLLNGGEWEAGKAQDALDDIDMLMGGPGR